MTGPRWRKVRADVRSNPGRTVLAVASIAVGTMAVGGMHLAGVTAERSFDASFVATNPPSAMLRTDPMPASLVDAVADHPAVGQAEGRRLLAARVEVADSGSQTVELVAMADFADNEVARIEPREGSWPPGPGELVVERASVAELGVELGDVVTAAVPGGAPVELEVVGTVLDVWEVAPTLGGEVRAYTSMGTVAELTGTTDLDALYLRAAVDPLVRESALQATAAVRDDVLAPAGIGVTASEIREPGEHRANQSMSFVLQAMQMLAVLAAIVAMALVVNTVAALLSQQRAQIGMMKAIGATAGQLRSQYLGYVLAIAAMAFAVSVPLSMLVGRFVAGFSAGIGNFELLPMGIPWATLGVDLALAGLLPVVAVLVAVRRATRLSVRDAVYDRGLTATGSASRTRFRLPILRPTTLAYRNAVRNRPRLVLTVLTVALSGAVLVGVLSTQRALASLTDQVAGYSDHDVELALTEPVGLADAAAVIETDAEVAGLEGWYRSQAFRIRADGTENENVNVIGAPPDSASLVPTLLEGRWLEPGERQAIVINTHLADEEPDLGLGSEVVLDIEGRRDTWTIVGVATTTLVGPVAYVSVDDLTASIDRTGQTNLLAVQLVPGADAGLAAERLDATVRDAGLPLGEVQTNAQIRAAVDELMSLVVGLLLVVGAVLAIVAVVGVAGTMTLNVTEQTREVGVIRAIGASNGAVRRLLLLQGLAVAGLGCVLGIVLSLPVGWLLQTAISTGLIHADLPSGFSWLGVGLWVVVALLIGAIGTTRPARVAARMTVRETLAYE
jgi:putative ABC transport system permease protein